MSREKFQPISVKPPSDSPLLFAIRCWFDLQLATIVKYLKPAIAQLQGRVLDVGAGESPWKEWLPKACTYQGIDVASAQEYGMTSRPQDVLYYDGINMPLQDSSFDAAMCIEVIEHARDPDKIISEIHRVLKNNSTLLLSVPFSARRHHIPNDFHRFTSEQLLILLERHDFKNVEIHARGNDVGAIASKMMVIVIRLLRPTRWRDVWWCWPILLVMLPISLIFVLVAHFSDLLGMGSQEDPLGYFVRAVCHKPT
jgi:SAM-dependent methyltransferase